MKYNNIRDNIQQLIVKNKSELMVDIKVLEFFSDAFCELENKIIYYRITSAFYNSLLNYEKIYGLEKDGLMYPSANTEAAGINIVLKKELVDNMTLQCTHAIMFSLQKMPNDPKNIKFMPASDDAIPDKEGQLKFGYIL